MLASVTSSGILVPLSFFALVGFIVYHGIKRKERKEMIERGMNPDTYKFDGSKTHFHHPEDSSFEIYKNVKSGLILIGVGLGFFLTKIFIYAGIFDNTFSSYFSLVALFGGIGLLSSYFLVQKLNQNNNSKKDPEKKEKKDKYPTNL
jgi:hypothetical protein